ncbi:MAG: response regulator, partial [Nannocystaceae bacterium]|nr:response regulator [Nannocystaceae bacterium]
MTVRVLIIDDSAVARKVLADTLDADDGIEVVGVSSSPGNAAARMRRCKPDVIALDALMEPIDGLTFLRKYMATDPIPTVLVSASGTGEIRAAALCAGALSVVEKPQGWDPHGMETFARELRASVRRAGRVQMRRPAAKPAPGVPAVAKRRPQSQEPLVASGPRPTMIAIGTSTGGAAALSLILPRFPDDAPPIVIVDHMPA